MDIKTSIYHLDDVPNEYLDFMTNSINKINELLNTEYYLSEVHSSDSFLENYDEYPFKPELTEYFKQLLGDQANQLYMELLADEPSNETIIGLVNIRNLIAEQDIYLNLEDSKCDIYLIVAYLDDDIYGSVYCFYNRLHSDLILFQGISKSLKYSLWDFLDKTKYSYLPRLNSVLMPAVESLAKRLNVTQILVSPIGSQTNILEKHYGFKRIKRDLFRYPCQDILGSDGNNGNYLYKEVP